jgi:hypothetical protein
MNYTNIDVDAWKNITRLVFFCLHISVNIRVRGNPGLLLPSNHLLHDF